MMLMGFVGEELTLGTARTACPCSVTSEAAAGKTERLGGWGTLDGGGLKSFGGTFTHRSGTYAGFPLGPQLELSARIRGLLVWSGLACSMVASY